jgi:hypothetical protein
MSTFLMAGFVASCGGLTLALSVRVLRAERASARIRDRILQYTNNS